MGWAMQMAGARRPELPAASVVPTTFGPRFGSASKPYPSPAIRRYKTDNVIELDVEKRHRDKLQQFETRVQDYQTGARSDDVDDVLDDVRDFLDRI